MSKKTTKTETKVASKKVAAPKVETEKQPRAKRPGVVAIETAGGNAAAITIASAPRMVVGGSDTSRAEQCLDMLRKSKTIGDYLAAREKAGMGATLGGYLPGWIEKGFVTVGKASAKPIKKTKPAKVSA
jgi:hypothetical protein